MRAKRETTYGMPTRILTNANRGRITQAAHDHDAAHRKPRRHNVVEGIEYPACRVGRPCATDPGAQAAGVAPHPRPDGPDHLPNAPCTYIRRWPTMPSGDDSWLTGSRVAPRQSLAVLP